MGRSRRAGALLVVALATSCGAKGGQGEKIIPLSSGNDRVPGNGRTGAGHGPVGHVRPGRGRAHRGRAGEEQRGRGQVAAAVQGVSACTLDPRLRTSRSRP